MSRGFNNFGTMLIGKAERPGPSLSPSTRAPQPSLEREEYAKMANDILHYSRLQKDSPSGPSAPSISDSQTETASLSSVATEKRSLLSRFRRDSASKFTSDKKSSSLSKQPNV